MPEIEDGRKEQPSASKLQDSRFSRARRQGRETRVEWVIRKVDANHSYFPRDGQDRAYRNLTREAHGRKEDFRVPIYTTGRGKDLKHPPREEILEILAGKMRGNSSGIAELDEIAEKREKEERDRVGPWSPNLPWEYDGPKKVDAIMTYKEIPSMMDSRAADRAEERARSDLRQGSVEPISYDEAIRGFPSGVDDEEMYDGMDTKTNSGFPYFLSGWLPTDDMGRKRYQETKPVYEFILNQVKEYISSLNVKDVDLPEVVCMTFIRLVQRGPKPYDPKSKRIVIAPPKWQAIVSKTQVYPRMQVKKELKSSIGNYIHVAWRQLSDIDNDSQLLLRHADSKGLTVLSGDISGMDQAMVPELIERVGRINASYMRGTGDLTENLAKILVNHTSLMTPSRYITPTPSSMKSGFGETNEFDSDYLKLALYYGEEMGFYKIDGLRVQGDDFNIVGAGVEPDSVSEALEHFGLSASPEKQFHEKNALLYLQRLHYLNRPGGIYPVFRALGHAMSLERFDYKPDEWNSMAYVVRALSQINNCSFSWNLPALIDTIKEGDRFKLGSDFTNPDDVVREAGLPGADTVSKGTKDAWRGDKKETSFSNWLCNGILRGEELPQAGPELFYRVYGESPA
jgi:hypothetical protein